MLRSHPFRAGWMLVLICTMSGSLRAQTPDPTVRAWIDRGIEAMGGAAALDAVRSVRLTADGHTFLVEQSERPEGPWIPSYDHTEDLLDLDGGQRRLTVESRLSGSTSVQTVASGAAQQASGARRAPGRRSAVEAAGERVALGPERVLQTARAASDLRRGSETVLQGVPHHTVAFTWQGVPVRLFLNTSTGLPTAVETLRDYPDDVFWGLWGDVTTRVLYSFWELQPGGVFYPRQRDEARNGWPLRTQLVSAVALGGEVAADTFEIGADVRTAFAARPAFTTDDYPLGRPDRPAAEFAPGVVQIPGAWDVVLVRQDSGVVVIEAPISAGYTARVIAEAARRFPGAPVRAVVTTSDAWPHVGGVRGYVARGIPIVALDLNAALLTRIAESPHTLRPDTLARAPHELRVRAVSGKTAVGSGPNRIEVYPVRGESGERMMVAYFPEHRLLYASDLVQRRPDGLFDLPTYLTEVAAVVAREGLSVERVFAMHADVMPWSAVLDGINAASASQP